MRWLLMAVMIVSVACGGSSDDGCDDDDVQAIDELVRTGAVDDARQVMQEQIDAAPDDATALLGRLDDAQDAFEDEDWPGCGDEVKDQYAAWMETADEALTAFSLSNTDQTIELLDDAQVEYSTANRMLTELAEE